MIKNKNAIITGGARGIGKEIARTLAENGANIAINYRTFTDELKLFVEELNSLGVKVLTFKCDVSKEEEVEEFIKEVKNTFGSIDILVNNAGITKDGLLLRMSEKDFTDVIDVNLKGTFNMTKAVSSIMVRQRYGKIINIAVK